MRILSMPAAAPSAERRTTEMKAILHHRVGGYFRELIEQASDRLQIVIVDPDDQRHLANELVDADVLLHVLAPVTEQVIRMAPRLRLIQKIGVGVDGIDRVHAKARGIAVCNMIGINTVAVAEMTLALIFSCLRQVTRLSEQAKSGYGDWNETGDEFSEIGGLTIGLVGYGAVSRQLSPVLRALGAQPIAFDRNPVGDEIEFVSFDELLARSDVVSLHAPASAETHHLMDARRLAQMRAGSILVNTARGSLVDESALAEALSAGHLRAAALDVMATEPPPKNHGLFALPNVVVTPHVAWLTRQSLKRSMASVLENCRRLERNEPLLNQV